MIMKEDINYIKKFVGYAVDSEGKAIESYKDVTAEYAVDSNVVTVQS
jgi:hypothetical protein